MKVCVDASLAMKWLAPEEGSEPALRLLKRWRKANVQLLSPPLLEYEIGSVLRKKVTRGLLRKEEVSWIVGLYDKLDIELIHSECDMAHALSLADLLGQPTIYDIVYVLLAEQHEVPFVTADERFFKVAHPMFSRVQFYTGVTS